MCIQCRVLPYVTAIALVAAPFGVGWLLALVYKDRTYRAPGAGWILLATLGGLSVAAFALPFASWVPPWDILSGLALLGSGAALSARRLHFDELVLMTVVTWVIAEVAVMLLLPVPPAFPHPTEATLTLQARRDYREPVCALSIAQRDRRQRVLHIGDSMVHGDGLADRDTAFPQQLARSQPHVDHVNVGISQTSADCHLRLVTAIPPDVHVDHVMLYMFTGNDIVDMDIPYPSTGLKPALTYEDGVARPNPRAQGNRFSVYDTLTRSPPPYALRVATGVSLTAGHVAGRWYELASRLSRGRPLGVEGGPGTDEQWLHHRLALAAIQTQLASRNIGLTAVVLPYRADLIAGDRSRQDRFVAQSTDLGIDTLDAWGPLDDLIRSQGEEKVFVPRYRDDVHFDEAGHDALSRWLQPELRQRLR